MSRVVELPPRGRLVVGTDLQGNLDDFERLIEVFEEEHRAHPEGATLVITGDMVHGPEIPEEHWPEYLGTFYAADSPGVLERARALADAHPGRVLFLLGNHEHAHVGGPIVSKFFADEAQRLEGLLGAERTRAMRTWFSSWPLIAYSRSCGLLMVHGAPNAAIHSRDEVDDLSLTADVGGFVDEVLAELLWARTASTVRARAFLRTIHPTLRVALYGHDVAREGYAIDREPLLCLSTSFGCFDGDKLYLSWDLAEPIENARDLAARGLRPLYPDVPPVYRRALMSSA